MIMYNELVLGCFFNPLHTNLPEKKSAVHAKIGNMHLSIEVNDGKIIKAGFKSRGNPYKIAGLEWLCSLLEGDLISSHPKIGYREIAEALGIPALQYAEAIALEGLYKKLIATAIRGEPHDE